MAYSPISTSDPDLNKAQDSIGRAFKSLEGGVLNGARLSALTAVTTTDTKVYHNLGRVIKGCIPCLPSANAVFYAGSASADPTKYINVKASVAASAYFLFF